VAPYFSEKPFEVFFRAHHLAVLRFARRRIGEEVAWDVVSETFLVAWRSWERRPAAPDEGLPWLYAIAGNVIRNQSRSEARATRLGARLSSVGCAGPWAQGPGTDAVADAAVDRDHALRVLEQLSDNDREILTLAAWEQLDVVGLAAALSISPAAAKVRLHRARQRLRALVDPPSAAVVAVPAVSHGGGSR
jgi:RNA polymerase sigma-70 factor (ECF subfamily)